MSLSSVSFEAWAKILHFTDYWHHARLASTGDKQVLRVLSHVERTCNLKFGPLNVYRHAYSPLVGQLLVGRATSVVCIGRQLHQLVGPFHLLETLVIGSPIVVSRSDVKDKGGGIERILDVAFFAPNLSHFELKSEMLTFALKLPSTLQTLRIKGDLNEVTCRLLMQELQQCPNLTSLDLTSLDRRRLLYKDFALPPSLTFLRIMIRADEEWMFERFPPSLTRLRIASALVVPLSRLTHLTSLTDLFVTDRMVDVRGCHLDAIIPSLTKLTVESVYAPTEEALVTSLLNLPASLRSFSFRNLCPYPVSADQLADIIDTVSCRVTDEDMRRIVFAVVWKDRHVPAIVQSALKRALVAHGDDEAFALEKMGFEQRLYRTVSLGSRISVYNDMLAMKLPESIMRSLFKRYPVDAKMWGHVDARRFANTENARHCFDAAAMSGFSRLAFSHVSCAIPPHMANTLTHMRVGVSVPSGELRRLLLVKLDRLESMSVTFETEVGVSAPDECWCESVGAICDLYENVPKLETICFICSRNKGVVIDAALQQKLMAIGFYPELGAARFQFHVGRSRALPSMSC